MTRVSTGGVVNFITVPSIVTVSGVSVVNTASPVGFMLHGQSSSGVLFTPKVAYASSTLPSNTSDRAVFGSGIAAAYAGSPLANDRHIAPFIIAANDPTTLDALGQNVIAAITSLGTSVANTSTPAVTAPVTPPPPVVPLYDPSVLYASGQTFTYSGATVTVSGTGIGFSSTRATPYCNTNDLVIWTGSSIQIWAACNMGANALYNPATNGWSGTIIDSIETNRITAYSGVINSATNFLGGYYQWGRNDPVSLLAT